MEWVKSLESLDGVTKKELRDAKKYPDAQTWWCKTSDWKLMLTALSQSTSDNCQLTKCVCDLTEQILPCFMEVFPNDTSLKHALETAKRCAESHISINSESLRPVEAAANETAIYVSGLAFVSAVCKKRESNFASAACVAKAASLCVGTLVNFQCALSVACCIDSFYKRNRMLEMDKKHMVRTIRKYFPTNPFVD